MESQAALETETADDSKVAVSPVKDIPEDIVKEIELEKPKKGGHKDSTEVSSLFV